MRKLLIFLLGIAVFVSGAQAGDVLEYRKIGLKERVERAAGDLMSDDGEVRRAAALELKEFIDQQTTRLGTDPEAGTAIAAMGKALTGLLVSGKGTTRVRAERVLFDTIESLSKELASPDRQKSRFAGVLLADLKQLISSEGDPHSKDKLLGLFPAGLPEPAPLLASAQPHQAPAPVVQAPAPVVQAPAPVVQAPDRKTGAPVEINPKEETAKSAAAPKEQAAPAAQVPAQVSSVTTVTASALPPTTVVTVKAPRKPRDQNREDGKSGEAPSKSQASPVPGLTVIPIVMDQLNSKNDDRIISGLKLTSRISDIIAPSLGSGGPGIVSDLAARIRDLTLHRNPSVRKYACDAASSLKDNLSVPNLASLLADSDREVWAAAKAALVEITGSDLGDEKSAWIRWASESRTD